MRIGYFGGSFDPPHLGHLRVAQAAKAHFALDRILLAPTGRQPLKPDGPSAAFPDRLALTELLVAGYPGLQASAIDAPHPNGHPNYTADTLSQLRYQLAPSGELFAILGADAFLTLPKWRDLDTLFSAAEWIVVSRPGFPLDQLEARPLSEERRAKVHLLTGLEDPTSATDLRSRLRTHQGCDDLLPPALCAYIRQHHLYGV